MARRGTALEPGAPRIILRRRAQDSAALRAMTRICPGACFRFGARDRIEVSPESCLRCGTCRTVGEATGEIEWSGGWPAAASV